MSITIRPMKAGEEEAVAQFVHRLADDLALDVVPRVNGEKLAAASDLVSVMVADDQGRLCGACLSLMTYSTFRGAKGLYVVDLFVASELRGRSIGERLLKAAARAAAKHGATFIKLEVDVTNTSGARFYDRLGFVRKDDDRLFIVEGAGLTRLLQEEKGS